MPMKHTKVNRSWRNSCFWARGCCVLTYPCLSKFNLLKMFLKHSPNLYVSQRPLWMGTLPDILPPFPLICASTLGNAPATCCCLASELRFCSSKALELPRRNHWGAESFGGVGRGCLFLSHHFPPKKMGRHLNHFDPENIGMYLSFFLVGWCKTPQKWIGMNLGSWLFETHPTSCERSTLEPIISCPYSRMPVEQEGVD